MSERDGYQIEQMRAVAISREYGSGGGEIARRLATLLGWQLVDQEIVSQVAQEMNVSEQASQACDEQAESVPTRIWNTMQRVHPPLMRAVPSPRNIITSNTHIYREALTKVIDATVARGHVVIVGRAAQVLLAERRDVFSVFVVAPLEKRMIYVMQREGMDRQQALERILSKDRDHRRYLQAAFKQQIDNPRLYDIVVNTAVIALDDVVDLLWNALRYKAAQLSTPMEALGPAASMTRYPNQPQDFPLSETR